MRETALKFVGIIVIFGMLAMACSNEQGNEPGTQTAASTGETRTITHLKGEYEIKEKPERVIALIPAYVDHILALGEKPYGVTVEQQFGGSYIPYLADQLEGVEIVGESANVNLEKILSLDPDLILSDQWTAEKIYAELNKIAPTIVLGADGDQDTNHPDYWQQDLMKIAEIYDKEDLAKQKIAELEQKVEDTRQQIDALKEKNMAFLRIRQKVIQIYPQTGHPLNSLLYEKFGFTPSPLTHETDRGDLSMEVIPQLNTDYIFLQVDASGGPGHLKTIRENPLWQDLNAVKNDKVFETDFWIYKAWGLIGREQITDEVLEYIQ